MDRSKQFYRSAILFLFDSKKTAAQAHRTLVEIYGDNAPSETTCRYWFQRFKKGDFDLTDKEHGKPIKRFNDTDLEELLKENAALSRRELAQILNCDLSTISRRLHAMGMGHKNGKWVLQEDPTTAENDPEDNE